MNEHVKGGVSHGVKVQSKDAEDQVTEMVIDLLAQKGFTFANFETVVAHVKSHYENNATI